MTIRISRELSLFNFMLLDILCTRIGLPFEMLWPFEFFESFRCSILSISVYYAPESYFVWEVMTIWISRAFVVQFQASQYIMRLNRTSIWKVMTIWISRELPLFNFERLHILCAWIGLPCDKLWPFEILEIFRCSILSISKCDTLELDFQVKSYDHLNFSRASVVQFRMSRDIMSPNLTSVRKVMTIRISRELPLFNFDRLDILGPRIGHPCDNLWQFKFLESFRCSISSV